MKGARKGSSRDAATGDGGGDARAVARREGRTARKLPCGAYLFFYQGVRNDAMPPRGSSLRAFRAPSPFRPLPPSRRRVNLPLPFPVAASRPGPSWRLFSGLDFARNFALAFSVPIYEYRCSACGHGFEALVASSQAPAPVCPQCGAARPAKQFSTFAAAGAPAGAAHVHSGPCCPCGQTPGSCGLN